MKEVTEDKFDYELAYEFAKAKESRVSEGTLTGYRAGSEHFLSFIEQRGQRLEDVDGQTIDDWIESMASEYAESSAKTMYNHIRTFVIWLHTRRGYWRDRGVLPVDERVVDVTDHIDRGKTRKSEEMNAKGGVVFVRKEEYELLKENVPKPKFRNELLLKIFRGTGMRRAEVAGLKCDPAMPHRDVYGDVDLDERKLSTGGVKKTKPRDLWFGDGIDRPLRRWLDVERNAVYYADESKYLFPSRNSEQLTGKRITSMVKAAAENAGIQTTMYEDAGGGARKRITPHALRHAFAVSHIRNGTSLMTLRYFMGHKSVSTTEIYLQYKDEMKKSAMRENSPSV